tara:strand:- start:476 stop:712 length:237 start_codon:yes stop_codon:yes gene_type:complete
MKNLTTPTAILIGLALIAVAVASIPYSNGVISTANAQNNGIQKIAICNINGDCADVTRVTSEYVDGPLISIPVFNYGD